MLRYSDSGRLPMAALALLMSVGLAAPGWSLGLSAGDDEVIDLDCLEFDRTEVLTALDTLTFLTDNHNPEHEQGYVYAYAVDSADRPVGFDYLVGQQLVVDGLALAQYSINAIDYRAKVAKGALTDLDGDGVRDLDGREYEKTAGELLVPRFLGHTPQRVSGDLILIALSGGTRFETTADFLAYNDDEDQFSANHRFRCWEKVPLNEVSSLFNNYWLKNFSGQNPNKSLGHHEYGWFRVFGGHATSGFFSINDPALYAVYIEKINGAAAADLPFERCTVSGRLLPRSVSGDNDDAAQSDFACGDNIPRRRPASLLVFPEFDNRNGMATVLSVSNRHASEDVRVHYVYRGRYGSN